MIALRGDEIRVVRYRVTANGVTHYAIDEEDREWLTDKYPNAEVEELDVSGALFLEGVKCGDIRVAKAWRELGYVPKTDMEKLQEVVDTLIINALEVE